MPLASLGAAAQDAPSRAGRLAFIEGEAAVVGQEVMHVLNVAALLAGGFAIDAFYGLLAPERQKRRDKKLRRLMKRRA